MPLIKSATNFVLFTLIPTEAAADGFVPTALIWIPNLVLFSKNHTNKTDMNER